LKAISSPQEQGLLKKGDCDISLPTWSTPFEEGVQI